MYQFFVEEGQICGDRIVITGEDVNHIKNVLRMKIGEEIAVSNGVDGREYRCEVAQLLSDEVVCKLRFIKENDVELPAQVYLFQGLPKADKMELIIQKAVELGVYSVIPVATRRSIVKLDDKKAAAKQNRWQGIAEAAAKQSKRKIIPKIEKVMSFAEALEMAKELEVRLIPYELAEDMSHTKEIIERIREGQKIAIFIGPEGGFDETEIALASEVGVEPITLGKRILRTETAGMTVLAWLMYHLEK
ncbi:MAG: 16S rRNA (uracil(1498)-N(3))-methyltransferase [Lachnospiraceae bacterium]|nr:16S rRNA (uracil(1498)-N(3))-methyltransferase [Clostridiales bacterium]MDY3108559.1 16S rRNA (uracil(1498)-N(3))-methyltransferase [Lachnospiraceae bacterium]